MICCFRLSSRENSASLESWLFMVCLASANYIHIAMHILYFSMLYFTNYLIVHSICRDERVENERQMMMMMEAMMSNTSARCIQIQKFTLGHQDVTSSYLKMWWGFYVGMWQWWHFQCKNIFSSFCMYHLRHQKDEEQDDMTWGKRCQFYLFIYLCMCVRGIMFVRIKYLFIAYSTI